MSGIFEYPENGPDKNPESHEIPGSIRDSKPGSDPIETAEDGIESISPDCIQGPTLRYPEFKGIWKDWIHEIQEKLSTVDGSSVLDWEDGFRSDWDAEAEIMLWIAIARTFASWGKGRRPEWRRDLYQFLVAVTMYEPSEIQDVLKSVLHRFGRCDVQNILNRLQEERSAARRQVIEDRLPEFRWALHSWTHPDYLDSCEDEE